MAIDWDAELLAPLMAEMGEGVPYDPSTWPMYLPTNGIAFPVPGAVFDEAYHQVVDLGDGTTGTTEHPILGVRSALFAMRKPAQGDQVFVPSRQKLFGVADVRPDGHGHTLLILIELVQ